MIKKKLHHWPQLLSFCGLCSKWARSLIQMEWNTFSISRVWSLKLLSIYCYSKELGCIRWMKIVRRSVDSLAMNSLFNYLFAPRCDKVWRDLAKSRLNCRIYPCLSCTHFQILYWYSWRSKIITTGRHSRKSGSVPRCSEVWSASWKAVVAAILGQWHQLRWMIVKNWTKTKMAPRFQIVVE